MTTNKNTLWVAGTAALALLMLVATYFLLVLPQRATASDLVAQTQQVSDSNAAVQQRTAQLKAQFATLDEEKLKLAAIREELPAAGDLPQLLRQLEGYATASGVTLTNVTPGTAVAFTADATATTTAGAPATSATTAPALLAVPLSLQVSGSFAEVELYVKNMQADMKRFFAVSTLDLTSGDGGVAATITGKVFVLQDTSSATTGTSGAATAASGSAATSTGMAN